MNSDEDMTRRYEEASHASNIGNFGEAFSAFSELAQHGHIGGIIGLAHMFLRGEGTARDTAKGLELLELATSCGDSIAAFNLGALHRSGDEGVPIDPEKSKHFFRLARDLGCEISIDDFL